VFAGGKAEGAPLIEERFRVADDGQFAWTISPPETFVTIAVGGRRPGYDAALYTNWFLPGDPASGRRRRDVRAARRNDSRCVVLDADGTPVEGRVRRTRFGRRQLAR
jgi:hypothetical protein